jgi:uncharacterized protein (TIGR01244 family)
MDIRPLTDRYAVSPMIEPSDLEQIRGAGYTTLLCNRPDAEVPPGLQAAAMREAAEALGFSFVDNPVTHTGLTPDILRLQAETIASAPGPVLAYCASGTRSTIVWALGQAGRRPADEIIGIAAKAGYDLSGMAPQLSAALI